MLLFQPPCSEAYNPRLSFRSKSKEQLNERQAGLSTPVPSLSHATLQLGQILLLPYMGHNGKHVVKVFGAEIWHTIRLKVNKG